MIDKTHCQLFGFDMYCDKCDETVFWNFEHEEFLEMIREAKSVGWTTKKVGNEWEHYCPECSNPHSGKMTGRE